MNNIRLVVLYTLSHVALGILAGCSSPSETLGDEAVTECADRLRVEACTNVLSGNVAMCYADNEVGPAPWVSDGVYPQYGCGAPVNRDGTGNTFGPPPNNWANWWCCAPSGCDAGEEVECKCADGASGRKFCRGDGASFGACVCSDSP